MATKKYNPYNSMRKIVDLKGSYDSAKWQGGNYQQHQDEAVQYYNDLINNGYAQQAADLSKYGYEDALNYLNNSGWKSDEETEFDEWYDNIGKVASGDKRTVSEQQTDYIDKLMGIGTGETSPQTSDAVSKLMDQWFSDNQTYIDRSGELHDAGMSGLDSLLNYDYTQQSFYQPIMDTYNLYGDNAANGALATGAAGNAGNIDSYAAANAARQQLAFTNAGHQAALAAAAQNQGSYLDLYGMMGANNSDLRLNNATTMNAINNMYSTDANERQAANDVIRQLFGDESAERVNATNAMVDKYLADLGLESTKYQTDAQERMNAANNQTSLDLQKLANELGVYQSDLEYAAKKYGYDAELSMNSANNQAAMAQLLQELAAEERMNTANNTAARSQQYYENKYAQEQADREHQYALDELFAQNGLSRNTKYTADQAATMVYNGVMDGAEEFSDIKSWNDMYNYVLEISGDPTGAKNAIEAIKKNSNLFKNSNTPEGLTFDYSGSLAK